MYIYLSTNNTQTKPKQKHRFKWNRSLDPSDFGAKTCAEKHTLQYGIHETKLPTRKTQT